MEQRLSLSIPRPVYVPAAPGLPLPVFITDEDAAPTLDIAKKARAAPN